MPAVKCPYCDEEFEWTAEMGESRVECPLCSKTMSVVRRKRRAGTEVEPKAITGWGTDGFRSEKTRAEYGQIKKGDVLGGFRIEEMIGAGAMAVVYKATQLSLDRPVALKILPKEFARKESFVRQFDSETDLLASLNHPNIVGIIDRGREADTYFFAMEYVEGTTLGELLAAGRLDEEFFLRIVEQCAEALSYAHSKGIIHRDIKPANIMLNDQGIAKVADFGVAGLLAEVGAGTGGKRRVVGTRGYMAPEQEVDVKRTDGRSDIFSLGAVMYRALTDTIPDHLPPAPPSRLNPEVDPRIDRLVLTCLEMQPDRRYQSAQELLEAVRAYHRETIRAQEVCPNCKKENPVTQKACLHCGADLSELFDLCPECGAENRIDVAICMACGTSLSELRQRTSVRISRTEDRARELALRHRYDEAVAELKPVLDVKGKMFQRARDKAQRLIASYERKRAGYYKRRVHEGKRLAAEGRLNESVEVLQSIPDEFAEPEHVAGFVADVNSRMEQARASVTTVSELLEQQQRYDEAEQALNSVAQTWVDCPGLEEARTQLQRARETEKMVEYELAEVRRHLDDGKFAQARQAIDFALTAMPDNPRVRELQDAIHAAEEAALAKNALGAGNKAFAEGRFAEAARCWTTARDMLSDNDQGRQKLGRNIATARRRLRDAQLASAAGEEAAVERIKALAIVLLFVVVGIILVGGAILYLMFAG